jgi:two-component system nitrate/nitrite response regulator NarL
MNGPDNSGEYRTRGVALADDVALADVPVFQNALILSEVRFLRDSLIEILQRETSLGACAPAATVEEALVSAKAIRPAVVLLDVAFPGGVNTVGRLRRALPQSHIVALGIRETEEQVLAWAEAGIAGYVPNTASVTDVISLVDQISRGEQPCSSRIAGSLLRRVAAAGSRAALPPAEAPSALTRRESEILHLVIAGYSNKDIARQLSISLGTTKSHVHNLLAKLCLHRRADVMTRMHRNRPEGGDRAGP